MNKLYIINRNKSLRGAIYENNYKAFFRKPQDSV